MTRILTRALTAAVTIASVAVLAAGQEAPPAPVGLPPLPPPVLPLVTTQDLLDGLKHPGRWLTYSGDYSGRRHSPLKQITVDNAHRLAAQWTFQAEGW
jgi:glucose dehydrogenase